MKIFFNLNDQQELLNRLEKLNPESKALWGKMNVNEMICHISDQLRLALGQKSFKSVANPLKKTLAKWLVFYAVGFPKKSKTLKELDQKEGTGTSPVLFSEDLNKLHQLMREFTESQSDFKEHPYFGKLNKREWGRVAYLHIDYHLKQFGV